MHVDRSSFRHCVFLPLRRKIDKDLEAQLPGSLRQHICYGGGIREFARWMRHEVLERNSFGVLGVSYFGNDVQVELSQEAWRETKELWDAFFQMLDLAATRAVFFMGSLAPFSLILD